MKKFYSILALLMLCMTSAMAVTITKTQGWFESGYVTWNLEDGATYSVYVRPEGGSYTKLDNELVRKYASYGRADMVGLKAGKYQFKVVSSKSGEAESTVFTATAHDRNGFAHVGMPGGIGAYKNDGTLKDNARVIYLTANNAKTVKCMVMGDKDVEYTGIQAILAAFEKGKETRPLAIRIVGTVKAADLDAMKSDEGLQVKGKSDGNTPMNITIEGIGNDATVHGFGFLLRNANSVEFRNFGIMLCLDDCVSLDTDNKHCWIHNMDFFYGGTGGAADQAKGDGTVDIKGKSTHITVSYNHFFDSGKCSLGGMKSEATDCWMTYHHNWFDHSDSRHPRIRTAFYHCYNNYYDGNAKYGIGVTSGGSSFVESNYFRNCKYPMLSSKQGTDAEGDGTFVGEPGGVIKAYNNKIINAKKIQWWSEAAQAEGTWDAVNAASRDEAVTATAYSGGTSYNSAADEAAREAVPAAAIDPVENVALICRGEMAGREGLGAGRIDGGDFKWTFFYPNQDANYAVVSELKSALVNYKSTLVGLADGTIINNGGATETVNGGDGAGKTQKIGDDTNVPSWGSGDATDTDLKPFIIGVDGDYYWMNETNDTQTKKYIADGNITFDAASSYATNKQATGTDFVGEYTGGVAVAKEVGYITFYCPDLILAINLKAVRAGSAKGEIQTSQDGTTFKKIADYSTTKKGTFTISSSLAEEAKYVRVTNTTTGTLYIHGIKVYTVGEAEPDERETCDLASVTKSKELNIKDTYTLAKGTDYTTTSDGAITFASANTKIATVDATGMITGVAEGTTTITIAQAGTETIKAGSATVTVIVKDPRAASVFDLSSNNSVSIKVDETSQITTTGAAGAVTYSSSKTSVATVSAEGLITAVAPGTAVITVTDAGTAAVKGAVKTVNVLVTKDMTGTEICYFTASTKTPSSSMVTVSGNYSDGKGTVNYNGVDYKDCVKMESATSIKITPASDCKVTLVFGPTEISKKVNVAGTTVTTDSNGMYSFSVEAGKTYELKKGDAINLFLIIFEPKATAINAINASAAKANVKKLMKNGKVVIVNGSKKYNAAGAEL